MMPVRDTILAAVLAALCCSSAVAVVYSKHLSRQAYADISGSRAALDKVEESWNRLQIEESTLAGHERIERTAREVLDMHLPALDSSVMITRRHDG